MYMRIIVFLMLVLPALAQAVAAQSPAKAGARSEISPFVSAQPYLLALSVADVAEAQKWYGDKLGFETLKTRDLPESGVSVAVMELHGFRLELVSAPESIPRTGALTDKNNGASPRGIYKLSFMVENLDRAASAFREQGVAFHLAPAIDEYFGVRYFIIRDLDGNLIQIVQRFQNR